MAANIASIKARTVKEAAELNQKIPISPMELFTAAAHDAGFALATEADSKAIVIKPFLSVTSLDGDNVGFAVMILVDLRPTGSKWLGRYIYETSTQYPRSAVAASLSQDQSDVLRHEAELGMREVLRLYVADGRSELANGQEIAFKEKFLTRRFDLKLAGYPLPSSPDRLLLRLSNAVFSAPRERVTLVN